jgi:hypothetical protein
MLFYYQSSVLVGSCIHSVLSLVGHTTVAAGTPSQSKAYSIFEDTTLLVHDTWNGKNYYRYCII